MTLRDMMPSNRLYRGDVTDFVDAMKTVKAQCDHEISACCRFAYPANDMEEIDNAIKLEESLNEMKRAANRCLAEYNARVMSAAKVLFEEWAKSDDENVKSFGEAALSGDYSSLAI